MALRGSGFSASAQVAVAVVGLEGPLERSLMLGQAVAVVA